MKADADLRPAVSGERRKSFRRRTHPVRATDSTASRLYLVAGLACTLLYLVLARHRAAHRVMYVALNASVLVALAAGIRRNRPRVKAAWGLLLLSELVHAAGIIGLHALPTLPPSKPSVV